ncbi:uncharacterized protein [Nicotiana sylvestris]|uniref:Neurofilament heavy polypeptide-like n=1 Tax=Nicotiana sylvestris TaxID=4096 RepID=A0A1U7XNJ8_NICSY|nr:PREDICTED: neurofilament heavy polypeptide-like [Nicotiana sylvestris]
MARTSKTVPQKEKAFSSSRTSKNKMVVPPRIEESLRDVVSMRPPPPGEGETQKPTKDKKRRKRSPAESPNPKKAKLRKRRADTVALTPKIIARLRAEDKERDEAEDEDARPLITLRGGGTDPSKAAEPKATQAVQSQAEEDPRGSSREVLEPTSGKKVPRPQGHLADELREPSPEVPRRLEMAPIETLGVIDVDDSPPAPSYFEGQIRDTQDIKTSDVGASHGEYDIFGEYFFVMLFDQAFPKSRAELARCEDDLRKLMSEMDKLKFQEKTNLVQRLRDELKTKEVVTLGWKKNMDRLASEKDCLREQLASVESKLQSEKEEGPANARAREISAVAEHKLSYAVNHAHLESRRHTLEEMHAKGFDLSVEIEKVKALEEEAAALLSIDEDSVSDSESGEDEDEVPNVQEASEDQAVESQTTKDVVSVDASPERVTLTVD